MNIHVVLGGIQATLLFFFLQGSINVDVSSRMQGVKMEWQPTSHILVSGIDFKNSISEIQIQKHLNGKHDKLEERPVRKMSSKFAFMHASGLTDIFLPCPPPLPSTQTDRWTGANRAF